MGKPSTGTQILSRDPPFATATDPLSTPKHSMFTSGLTLAALLQSGNVLALEIPAKPLTGSVSGLVEVKGVWGVCMLQ